mgnify:CR=1 FL=1
MKKVYFVNGFLEAGKTTFIKELLSRDYFDTGEKTLVLLCEDGLEEYTDDFCREHHLTVEMIEDEEAFTDEKLKEAEQRTNPERIIIEFNGMWNPEHKLDYWSGEQIMMIVIIDATTFELYLNNMKPYVKQQIADAYMTVFRSCDGKENRLAGYRRSIRALNPQTNFVFKNKEGEMNPRLDEDLPYNIQANQIELTDEAFGIFYIDAMEYVTRYKNKIVSFTGKIFKKRENMLLIGRKALTCCSEDLTMFAFICDARDVGGFEEYEWVRVDGQVKAEYFEKLQAAIPIIQIIWIEKCQKPGQEVVNIY